MNAPSKSRRVVIGQIPIDSLSLREALDAIEQLVSAGRGGAVFTPNVDHVVLAERDARFRLAYSGADLCLADGMPLVWASRLLGERLPERVSGADLVVPLMQRARTHAWRVYLLGAGPGIAQRASAALCRAITGLQVVGAAAPQIDMDAPRVHRVAVLDDIRRSRADLVLVALGAPKQELFVSEALPYLRPSVLLGIGASLDFIAGSVRRCPQWVSTAGLEWLYRLSREPRRLWRRYLLRDPQILALVGRQRLHTMIASLDSSRGEAKP
jgi:N-acetylglucosaminyldiphosphoundecaprenol N-acetyl-beta-D-mannosaminyltransferase